MTAAEWMDEHGLKVGDEIYTKKTGDIFEDYRGIRCKIVHAWDGGSDLITVCIREPDHRQNGIELEGIYTDFEPISSTPKPSAQEYSPFPMLAEFLS